MRDAGSYGDEVPERREVRHSLHRKRMMTASRLEWIAATILGVAIVAATGPASGEVIKIVPPPSLANVEGSSFAAPAALRYPPLSRCRLCPSQRASCYVDLSCRRSLRSGRVA
jgi:hypothetical protein